MGKINKTKYALLGVLSLIDSGSGYDLKKFCDSTISFFWNENYGHIYPVLKQMEEEAFVEKRIEHNEGRPSKNIYRITETGLKELYEWIDLPLEPSPARSELLLKLFFMGQLPKKMAKALIGEERSRVEKKMAELLKTEAMLKENEGIRSEKGYPYWLACLNRGKREGEAALQWCDETEVLLDEMVEE